MRQTNHDLVERLRGLWTCYSEKSPQETNETATSNINNNNAMITLDTCFSENETKVVKLNFNSVFSCFSFFFLSVCFPLQISNKQKILLELV